MVEYGREQRNQLSRAVANNGVGNRQLKKIIDNRCKFPIQALMAVRRGIKETKHNSKYRLEDATKFLAGLNNNVGADGWSTFASSQLVANNFPYFAEVNIENSTNAKTGAVTTFGFYYGHETHSIAPNHWSINDNPDWLTTPNDQSALNITLIRNKIVDDTLISKNPNFSSFAKVEDPDYTKLK